MPVLETKGALSAQGYGITTSIPQNYIENFFSTWLYTGNGTAQTIQNGVNLQNLNESRFTVPGTYSWVCPSGVSSVSVVCVGGGGGGAGWNNSTSPFPTPAGGGGGGLGYKNNISVTPGQTYTVVVGSGGNLGAESSNGIAGQDSYFINTSTVRGGGGGGGVFGGAGGSGGTFTGDGGGNGGPGGVGAASGNAVGGGGGGAGGYSGTGGTGGRGDLGGSLSAPGTAGSGGAAGGGSSGLSTPSNFRVGGGGGGGVGLLGQGTSGAATSTPTTVNLTTFGGKGGSGGGTSPDVTTPDTGYLSGGAPGLYGGGGAGGAIGVSSPPGASGAVRIVWNSGVMFPSTNTGEVVSASRGLVWIKNRTAFNHALYDTARGATFEISSNLLTAQTTQLEGLTSFNLNGFTIGSRTLVNRNTEQYVSWSFCEQSKFFDIVTWTGNGANRTITHNLGSVPGCIMVKRTDTADSWQVYHRSLANTQYLVLNSTAGADTDAARWNSTTPTASVFSLGTDATVNASGGTYVAYIFAHNAGGFGATGTDNVISCGSYTGNGSATGPLVTLGYEPQWLLIKNSTVPGDNWFLVDNMRGFVVGGQSEELEANTSDGRNLAQTVSPTSTGFRIITANQSHNASGNTYIYIAIRRGPMRTPTTGTSVFSPIAWSAGINIELTTGFPVDAQIFSLRTGTTNKGLTVDRLRGVAALGEEGGTQLLTPSTAAETTSPRPTRWWGNTGFQMPSSYASTSMVFWSFSRAPGFFDVVCYTGTGANRTVAHNLGVVPELMIVKSRSGTTAWQVYSSALLNTEYLVLNTTAAKATGATRWNSTAPTNSAFSLGTASEVNTNNATYVAYLFASCPGVSKVGSYTGTGATQVINCGFAAGARFVLIKRTDSTGDWYVWDSARGIVAGNDPYLILNAPAAAEVTNTDWVDTAASGFEISNAGGNLANTNGASYIFLAIS